jgi:hypothetical protein
MAKKILILVCLLIVAGVAFVERTEIKKQLRIERMSESTPVPVLSPTPSPVSQVMTYTLVIQNKKLVQGPDVITVKEGDTIILKVTSDMAEELHIHGYDKSIDLEKNKESTLTFEANLSGRFVFELENSKIDIGAIEVQPK